MKSIISGKFLAFAALLSTMVSSSAASPFFFVPLSVETKYQNGEPHHVSKQKEAEVGLQSWAFANSRIDPGENIQVDGLGNTGIYSGILSWIMPASRADKEHAADEQGSQMAEAFLNLPSSISQGLATTNSNRSEVTELQEKLASDVSTAVEEASKKNVTRSQLQTPGFFDSFSMVSQFLNQMAHSIFLMPIDRRTRSADEDILKDYDATSMKEDVVLPSFGEAGDIANDVIRAVLNGITVYKLQRSGPDCARRLLCESNKDIFSRGYTLPALVSYAVNLYLAGSPTVIEEGNGRASELLWAARMGRKGEVDCVKHYPNCPVRL